MTVLEFVLALICIATSLSAIMAAAWLAWRRTGNSGWVDMIWTFGLGTVGCVSALAPAMFSGSITARQGLVALLVIVWSLRLGLHIARRTAGIIDDPRYAKLIRDWGADAPRGMFCLLQKQALVSIPLALSILLAAWNPLPGLRVQDVLGVIVLMTGIVGEAVADAQLRRFRAAGQNRICDVGLWGWSRHPNYFFEWLSWVAYPVIAIDFSGHNPYAWLSLAAPACMYWVLVHVSGIPPLEDHMLRSRGEAFRAYQKRTRAFFPLPLK